MNSQRLQQHNPKNVASEWLQNCTSQEEREERIEYLRNCTRLFDQLKGMIQRRYDSCLASNVIDYDNISWAHKQAHLNGRMDALEEIYKLLP